MEARKDPQAAVATENQARILLALLVLNVVSSAVHYTDNILRWSLYPEPRWDNAGLTDTFWFVMTPLGIAAYLLFRRGSRRTGLVLNYVYGAMNLVVLGHYLFASPWAVSLSVNASILFETATAACLLGYTAWLRVGEDPLAFEA
jgi:hypothetical protein